MKALKTFTLRQRKNLSGINDQDKVLKLLLFRYGAGSKRIK